MYQYLKDVPKSLIKKIAFADQKSNYLSAPFFLGLGLPKSLNGKKDNTNDFNEFEIFSISCRTFTEKEINIFSNNAPRKTKRTYKDVTLVLTNLNIKILGDENVIFPINLGLTFKGCYSELILKNDSLEENLKFCYKERQELVSLLIEYILDYQINNLNLYKEFNKELTYEEERLVKLVTNEAQVFYKKAKVRSLIITFLVVLIIACLLIYLYTNNLI